MTFLTFKLLEDGSLIDPVSPDPVYDENHVITNHSYEFAGASFPSLFPATNNFTVLTRGSTRIRPRDAARRGRSG